MKLFKILVLATIKIVNNKIVNNNNNSLKLNLSKFKKLKIIRLKNLAILKKFIILFNITINIRIIRFLIFKSKIIFN